MDVLGQKEIYRIIKASQKRRNENAEGKRKREDSKNKYVKYFSRIFAGSAGEKTSEPKPQGQDPDE